MALNNIGIGARAISGRAYPNDAIIEIKVERSGQVIFTGTPRLQELKFEQALNFALKEDDEVIARVTAHGFKSYEYSTSTY